jgi:hypothetical protein
MSFLLQDKKRALFVGMKWLAGGIRQLGLKPGSWIEELALLPRDCWTHVH